MKHTNGPSTGLANYATARKAMQLQASPGTGKRWSLGLLTKTDKLMKEQIEKLTPTKIYPYSTPEGIRELVPLEDYEALNRESITMREAISDAYKAIKVSPYPDQQALAKLRPYITP